jgi:DNA-binding winged helix-turn-helix (wHTH) protein
LTPHRTVPNRATDILIALVERAGEVVTNQDLFALA